MSEPTPAGLTASLIAQLRELIRLLETKPGLPLGEFGITDITYHAESAEAVEDVARILGVETAWNDRRTHYRATYRIGTNVSYEALYITPEHTAAYREHMNRFHHGEQEAQS